jgi:hypothetical protein
MLAHYFYLPLGLSRLSAIIEIHQQEFEILLEETFPAGMTPQEENLLDSIAAVYAQPLLPELSFEDFEADPGREGEQREFFSLCQSTLVLENMPFLETNFFQVTYLKMLLARFSEVLIDRGGVQLLQFKQSYLDDLARYRALEKKNLHRPVKNMAMGPMDQLFQDVRDEISRIKTNNLWSRTQTEVTDQSSKIQHIFHALNEETDPALVFQKAGLNPKDFGDGLERLKFILKKIR